MMTDDPSKPPNSTVEVQKHLQMISALLRHADHLEPEAQSLLADLVEELNKSLESSEVPSAEIARLTECANHLVQAVQQGKEHGVLQSARDRLERAVIAVESEAPGVAGITRRLAEMLANLGI